MKVMVTGATGFVGQHVVSELLQREHSVIAVARDVNRYKIMPWRDSVEFIACDLQKNYDYLFKSDSLPDAIIHLSWSGLPNYRDFFHVSKNLTADLAFLEYAVTSGVPQLVIAGTCLEYGMQSGPLTEDMLTAPTTSYGFAKDVLRKSLQLLQSQKSFQLKWMRLFYMYGPGQNSNSLLAQLDNAIRDESPVFNMSMGDQLRDYLPIEEVAENFALVLESHECDGVINCASGKPVAVIDLVRQRCFAKNSIIDLNRGHYSYPSYEPIAFWGVPDKLNLLKAAKGIV
jgi:nucleoside-diphosphate-sugar epimerase